MIINSNFFNKQLSNKDENFLLKTSESKSKSSLDKDFSIDISKSQKINLSINDFKIIQKIGKGSYAKVVLATKLQTNENFAIKIINKKFIEKQNKVNEVHIERQIISIVSHTNIIKLYYAFHNEKNLYYVYEHAKNGDLRDYLYLYGIPSYTFSRYIIAEIVSALEYLHLNNIVHRDLKPENIVLNDEFHIKLIDFATATYIDKYFDINDKVFKEKKNKNEEEEEDDNNLLIGTTQYLSPEMITDNISGFEGDLWALGCIIYQLFHNSFPFSGLTNYELVQNIIQNKMKPIDKHIPNNVRDLINCLLVLKPKERLGANLNYSALKSHPFFEGINFDTLSTVNATTKLIKRKYSSFESNKTCVKSKYSNSHNQRFIEVPPVKHNSIMLTSNHLYIIHEEKLKKKSPWFHYNKRRLLLFKNRLEYYDTLTNTKKGEILLKKNCSARIIDAYCFEVITTDRTFFFKCESKTSVRTWCEKITQVIDHFICD